MSQQPAPLEIDTDREFDPDESCPVCQATPPYRVEIEKDVFQYRRCRGCGLLYAIPRPTAALLLRRLTFWAQHSPGLTPEQQEAGVAPWTPRVDWLRAYHPGARRLLDIGAGQGAFVAAARRAGLDAQGLELVAGTTRFADADMLVGDVLTIDLPARAWDVVTLWDTVEHLRDPLAVVRRALELLRPDGILVMETPNERGISGRLRGGAWWVFGPADHLVMFSSRTLPALVERAGGRTILTETRQLCPWNDGHTETAMPWWGRALERSRPRPRFQSALTRLGLGDWIWTVARPA